MSTHSTLARPDVSILVVAYNSADLIEKCINSIDKACERFGYEVLMVDNGDGSTQELVAKCFPNVKIVPSQGNVGFAAGNNWLARKAKGRFLLLLNPDVELKANAVDILLEASSEYPSASAWGGVTLDATGVPDVGNTVHVPSLREMASRVLGRSIAGLTEGKTFDTDEQASTLSGGFVLISRFAWDEAGGLDERYFLYCEEVDFFYRLGLNGHSFWRIADARAHHDIGHGQVVSPMRALYQAAGIMQFARLHWGPAHKFSAFILMWLAAWQRFVVGSLLKRRGLRFAALAKSNRRLALSPNDWRFGYDPQRGLLAKLKQSSA
jgi:GT2 family glycosyltransferase